MIPFAEIYYGADENEKANAIVGRLIEIYGDDLRYFSELKRSFVEDHYSTTLDRTVRILKSLSQLAKTNGQDDLAAKADAAVAVMGI